MTIISLNALRAVAIVAGITGVAACQTTANESDRLSADQVRATFIDREWTQGTGTFIFSGNGNYSYSDPSFSAEGTYQIADDGELCTENTGNGRRTCYTFYRDGEGYRYWHDRSGKFWPARLK
ncbi:MAG: hypothetical protein CMM62_20420 [Rhodospirillaceae bacterium]|jgi:hypothetical protein|nr:hypothetical protein [Rhodospirillaceae bacterium]MAX62255.1 hypothetical protein [Rhodospirillaceae bacterium]MAX65159.1 hypothetical protein [Rhodospirillaceae bacterium]MBB59499.1 hypothetical protein [Rhodospirillaceae bacterium]|tara:strand:+ start:1573 stop:1941 length:369 start_codon:yes stop_codon:yes gene_type:complete